MHFLDREIYRRRLGDPSQWEDDWRRAGAYLDKEQQQAVHARLEAHAPMLVGMSIRRMSSRHIAAFLCVSRESVDRRLRPLGLKNPPGQVGRPPAENWPA